MITEWDYSHLAEAYLKRPDYSMDALNKIYDIANLKPGMYAADIGAGVGHLTLHLLNWNLNVTAIEPNDSMRKLGENRTKLFKNIKWIEAISEKTLQEDNSFDFISFGSSFNVADRTLVLKETARILKPHSWFTCMWNHRDLTDNIQNNIENIFERNIPNYSYGTRREDQTEVIEASNLFNNLQRIEGQIWHEQRIEDVVEAWRSHATLHRQAGDLFPYIISEVEKYLQSLGTESIRVPYTTRAWIAQKKS